MKKIFLKKLFFIITIVSLYQIGFSVTKLYLDTNYSFKYVDYLNLDFNNSTSTDTYNKIYSELSLGLKTLIDNLEFNIEMCSIGEVGKKENSEVLTTTTTIFSYQNYPYPNLKFQPWLAQFYAKYSYSSEPFIIPYLKLDVDAIKFSLLAGRHRKEFVEGLVIGDNKIGYDGVSFDFDFGKYFYINSFFTKIKTDEFTNKSFSIYSFVFGSKFYESMNFGLNNTTEDNSIENSKKVFYEFFVSQQHDKYNYIFEYIMQKGKDDTGSYNGSLWFFKGSVSGKNKYFGRSSAGLVWLLSSGGSVHETFLPTLGKMYDYMEPFGFGEFARANINNIFLGLPDGYSGMFVFGINLSISPLKNFYSDIGYYLFSSPYAPSDRPEPSSTEKTLGAKKAIGVEYDFKVKYKIASSTFVEFSYSIFDPSKNAYPERPKSEPATKASFSLNTKF